MSAWLRCVAADNGLDEHVAWKAELCLNEVVSNIMMHAHEDGGTHPISIEIESVDRSLRMTIVDDGKPFDPLVAESPLPPHSLEEAGLGGRGIDLMRSYATAIEYRREELRNVLALTFAATEKRGQPGNLNAAMTATDGP